MTARPARKRDEQPCGRRRRDVADVHQHERTGSVRVLRHARLEAGLAEESRLLVAGNPRNRDLVAEEHAGSETAARRFHIGQQGGRHAEQVEQLRRPVVLIDVVQHRAARVGEVRRVHRTAGQIRDEPGVDRAERELP